MCKRAIFLIQGSKTLEHENRLNLSDLPCSFDIRASGVCNWRMELNSNVESAVTLAT